ncbi:hypothetical protein D3C84_696440 [compost metagenome]
MDKSYKGCYGNQPDRQQHQPVPVHGAYLNHEIPGKRQEQCQCEGARKPRQAHCAPALPLQLISQTPTLGIQALEQHHGRQQDVGAEHHDHEDHHGKHDWQCRNHRPRSNTQGDLLDLDVLVQIEPGQE